MNIKSASGFPTPNTVCVRVQARCAHFVQAPTRSRTAASKSAFSGAPGSPLRTADSTASTDVVYAVLSAVGAAVVAGATCNSANAVLDARGVRLSFSRILSSAAMTKSRAGRVMCSDHLKFRARLQTISVKNTSARNFGLRIAAELDIRRPGSQPRSRLLRRRGGFANRRLDPTIPLRRRAPF
jgi:hypothetical protein